MFVPAFTKRISERKTCLECECLHLVDGVLSWIKPKEEKTSCLPAFVSLFCALFSGDHSPCLQTVSQDKTTL